MLHFVFTVFHCGVNAPLVVTQLHCAVTVLSFVVIVLHSGVTLLHCGVTVVHYCVTMLHWAVILLHCGVTVLH